MKSPQLQLRAAVCLPCCFHEDVKLFGCRIFQDEDDIPRRVPKLGDVTLADIPPEIGLFPLSGVVLLPRGRLPLNVFEPRYIALVEDALATQRLIGMIQPRWREEEDEANSAPPLYPIGCLGRIVSFTERADGTYAITLAGLTRFRLLRETEETRGYRQARIDVSTFAGGSERNSVSSV